MSIRLPRALPPPLNQWFDPRTGRPTDDYFGYARELDRALRSLIAVTEPVTVATLSTTATPGDLAYASDGRKAGEGAGSGTGVLVFRDATDWIAVDTGAPVED